jgi:ankyrin repeat protein
MSDVDEELLEAARTGNLASVKNALENGADVDAREAGFGRTALMTASMNSAIPIMQALLDAGAGVNLTAQLGETALILAASGRGGE